MHLQPGLDAEPESMQPLAEGADPLLAGATAEPGEGAVSEDGDPMGDVAPVDAASAERWTAIAQPPFVPQNSHVAWTGEELLVVGGATLEHGLHNQGAAYNPDTDAWRSIAPAPQATYVSWDRAHWSGAELLIYGLDDAEGEAKTTAAYDPATDTWRQLPPAPLTDVTGVVSTWTGAEMLLLGSPRQGGQPVGAAYDPATDTWRPLPPFPLPETRYWPSAIWTDSHWVIWGGASAQVSLMHCAGCTSEGAPSQGSPQGGTGAAYDPVSDRWQVLDVAAEALVLRPSAWTGQEIISTVLRDDGRVQTYALSPDLGTVRRLADGPETHGERPPTWTGKELVFIGDRTGEGTVGGAALDPVSNSWRLLPNPGFEARTSFVVGWTQEQIIVLGGQALVYQETARETPDAFAYTPPP